MAEEYPGPFCKKTGITTTQLQEIEQIEPLSGDLTNGIILEFMQHCTLTSLVLVLGKLKPELVTVHPNTLKSRLNRVQEVKKRLASKKKVKGIHSFEDFKQQVFDVLKEKTNGIQHTQREENLAFRHESPETSKNEVTSLKARLPLEPLEITNKDNPQNGEKEQENKEQIDFEEVVQGNTPNKEEKKNLNFQQYQLARGSKALRILQKRIEAAKSELDSLKKKLGHYSVRNVNKRDDRARSTLKELRVTRQHLYQVQKEFENANHTIDNLSAEVTNLKNIKDEEVLNSIKAHEQKKLNAQKTASYYRNKAFKLKAKLKADTATNEEIKRLKALVYEKNEHIQRLEVSNEELKEKTNSAEIKKADGSYSDNLRLCILELTGLEVACEKVSPVIQAISKHLFHQEFQLSDLPSSSTVQTIVDEGHFLVKSFISSRLSATENWGLNRDGTTRKKQEILDTSITLGSGEIVSLGFCRVGRETSETITSVTKDHLQELADLNVSVGESETPDDFLKTSLSKLAFTMSDRASNEKKADKLLDEWRDEYLDSCGDEDRKKVLHFHCMAHVLLGFHRNVCAEIKNLESELCNEHGKLGRDGLTVFKFWSTKGTAVERTLRTVSEVFGPSGDHHGVRDLWEAYCAVNGIKSTIGNYRDNRFNALFQTAAEVCLHKDDFLTVLLGVKNPNLKLKSVIADLQSPAIMTLVQCLGLFYVKITGPYWNLVTSNEVPFLQLFKEITQLNTFLELCAEDPAQVLQVNRHWSDDEDNAIIKIRHGEIFASKLVKLPELESNQRQILLKAINITAQAMQKTINKQLSEFLPGGSMHQGATDEDIRRTGFSHLTNLGCEHHFGDLDSSQRRRPNASFHHHTSVQLLKRSRKQMMTWLENMPNNERGDLLQAAKKGGKALRNKHKTNDQSVLAEIALTQQSSSEGETSKSKRNKKQVESVATIKENDYVAIAYQDSWYPGIVIKKKDSENFVVKFMTPSQKFGYFTWPTREDIQTVNIIFVLQTRFVPLCENSGRMWRIAETNAILEKYQEFSDAYF